MAKKTNILTDALDRVSARMGFLLAALLPLVAIALTHFFSGAPKGKISDSFSNNDLDSRLVDFCVKNVKEDRSFVLFQYGTCVVVENLTDAEEVKARAVNILKATATPDARFVCTPVEDNNLIVSYTEPVFHLRFSEDMERHRNEIEADFRRFLTQDELADITPSWEPPFHAKVGLRSRARLLKDAGDPVISRIIAPRISEKTSASDTASVSY